MRQPHGFEEKGKESWVWKLKKAIYGLKQGGREWYTCIDEFFKNNLGFVCTFADHSIYVYKCRSSVIIVPLYVDDLLIGFKDETHMLHIKKALEERFKMTDAGLASWVLGMQI